MGNLHHNHTHTDAATVAQTLADRAETIAPALLGEPTAKSRREYRWGSKGSLCLCLVGPKRGIWCDFERLEGGDMLDLVARQHDVRLGVAIEIAQRDYLAEAIAPPIGQNGPSQQVQMAPRHVLDRR